MGPDRVALGGNCSTLAPRQNLDGASGTASGAAGGLSGGLAARVADLEFSMVIAVCT